MTLKTVQHNTEVRAAMTRHFKPPENQRVEEGIPPFPTGFCINTQALYFNCMHQCVACRTTQSHHFGMKQQPRVMLGFSYGRKV